MKEKDKRHEEKYQRQKEQIDKLAPLVEQILSNLRPLKYSS